MLRLERMLFGSVSSLPISDLSGSPEGCAGLTGGRSTTCGLSFSARSSTAAPGCSLAGSLAHAATSSVETTIINLFMAWLLLFRDYDYLANGPHAGSRTSPLSAVRRCFTLPSLETADRIPRPLAAVA